MLSDSQVKPYRIDLGTGCMRSRDYPVVKTSISFFLFLFFSLCVSELFFFRNAYSGAYFALFRPADRNKGKFTSKLKRPMYEAEVSIKTYSDRGGGGGGGLQNLNLYGF